MTNWIYIICFIITISVIIVLASELNEFIKRRTKLKEERQEIENRKQLQEQYTQKY